MFTCYFRFYQLHVSTFLLQYLFVILFVMKLVKLSSNKIKRSRNSLFLFFFFFFLLLLPLHLPLHSSSSSASSSSFSSSSSSLPPPSPISLQYPSGSRSFSNWLSVNVKHLNMQVSSSSCCSCSSSSCFLRFILQTVSYHKTCKATTKLTYFPQDGGERRAQSRSSVQSYFALTLVI